MARTIGLCTHEDCTGCTACQTVCPVNAIEMREDACGFLYPEIDAEKCVQCGACAAVVQKLANHMQEDEHHESPIQYYAVKLKDDTQRMNSQSGGLFYAMAESVIQRNGVVYGCAYVEDFHVAHIRVETVTELQRLRGSKYVQSDMGDCFSLVAKDLQNNKYVLFSGTPCQCAGIEAYLQQKKINTDCFFSCDVICHGVPSPGAFGKYLAFMEQKFGAKAEYVNLRDKKAVDWHAHLEKLRFMNGKTYTGDIWTECFYSGLMLRQSCENCRYTNLNRPSDITIGDCWGIEKEYPDLWNDEKGISVAIIQTFKGLNLFRMAEEKIDTQALVSYTQPQLCHSSPVPKQKQRFWTDYQKLDFEELLKKYTSYGGLKLKLKRKFLRLVGRW